MDLLKIRGHERWAKLFPNSAMDDQFVEFADARRVGFVDLLVLEGQAPLFKEVSGFVLQFALRDRGNGARTVVFIIHIIVFKD